MNIVIVAVLIFCIFIIYKEKGVTKFFFLSLAIGWIMGILNFFVYLNYVKQRDLYLYIFWHKLPVSNFIPKYVTNSFDIEFNIFLLNLGILLFIYSMVCFSISFTRPLKRNMKIYIIALIVPILELIIYSPYFFKFSFKLFFLKQIFKIDYVTFYQIEEILNIFTCVVNYLYMILSVGLIFYQYKKTARLRYFKLYVMLIVTGLITIILSFTTILWWAPKRMISVTTVSDYVHVLPVSILFGGRPLQWLPIMTVIFFVLLGTAMYFYNNTYLSLKNMSNYIVKSMDITSVGMRFFTHMIKNYVMATIIDAEKIKSISEEGSNNIVEYSNRIIDSSQDVLKRLEKIKSRFSLITLNLELMEIRKPIESALNIVSHENVEVRFDSKHKNTKVLIDEGHFTEVIVNLINNAVESMNKDKKILTIELFEENIWAGISINDTGVGIEKENIKKIFTPFYTTKNRNKNWGLGLSYCYRVIMAHKGKIFIESENMKGTTVKIVLPLLKVNMLQN